MMHRLAPRLLFPAALLAAALLAGAAQAGTIPLAWDAVNDPDLVGYRIYYDTQPGPSYRNQRYVSKQEVGSQPEYTLSGLQDCTRYYVAIKAWNGSQESDQFSNEIAGFSEAVFSSGTLSPGRGDQGSSGLSVRASGENFVQGAQVDFQLSSNPGISISNERYVSCREVSADLTIDSDATPGSLSVTVVVDSPQQDGTWTTVSRSFPFEIPDPDEVPVEFAVTGATPEPNATGVDPGVTAQVYFNNALNPKKVRSDLFKILRVGPPGRSKGKARLASGSPSLESDGKTVTMTVRGALAGNERYAVWVKGGKKGVKDLEGNILPSTWQQVPGFVTRAFLEDISYSDSPSSSGSSLMPSAEVPTDSVFVIEFSETVSASTASKRNAYIKWPKKGKIPLEGGAPRLSADGRSIILEPAGILPAGTRLLLVVKGKKLGVKSARGVILTESKITTEFTTPVGSVSSMGVAD